VMSGRVNRHNMRKGEPFEHERGSPEVNVVTAIHSWNAPSPSRSPDISGHFLLGIF
jgi:hypothetical protein